MDHEQTAQVIGLASSCGQDTDRASILKQLARLATPDELRAIASGGVDPETRSVLFAAAALPRPSPRR